MSKHIEATRPHLPSELVEPNADVDWSLTPLGPIQAWPASLMTAAALVFAATPPMMLFWGPEFVCVMNAAARALRGLERPIVAPAAASWPDAWTWLERGVRAVFDGGPAAHDLSLPLQSPNRRFTLTCSPIPDPTAPTGIGGVLALCVAAPPETPTKEVQQAEEALRHTQKMAELGHLTGGVAHDFNNLLGAMIGSFELIRRKHDDPERVRMLADAGLLVAERGARLTAQLLMFSRAQPIKLTPVSISAVVDGMREMLRRTLGPLIDVNIDISCGRSFILSDRTQLEMALLNLAINARDAMPEGGLLTIAATLDTVAGDPALEPGEYVELLVRDTGIGMSPDVASRAFDPFFTTKGIGQGTGLGLSQVHGLARQAGGAVRIESQPGRGTTIRMLLPCTDAPFLFERPAQIPPEQGEPQDATVLLVDDDQDLRSVLAASLQDLGYSVIEAVDGAEGLVLLEQHEPDLLVADFAMPGMSGAELARSARLLHPGLPIIFASGLTERLDIETAAGPDTRVLRKPFRISELQREIQGALSARA